MDIALFTSHPAESLNKRQRQWIVGTNGNCSAADRQFALYRSMLNQFYSGAANPHFTDLALTTGNTVGFVNQLPRHKRADAGRPVIHGEGYKPSAPLVIERHVRTSGKYSDFERAKREGKIVIKPVSHVKLSVADNIVVDDYAWKRNAVTTLYPADLVFNEVGYFCGRNLYDTGEGYVASTPRINNNNEWSIAATFTCYKDAKISSGLTKHRGVILQSLETIASAIKEQEFSTGLITSGTAELNSAYWDIATELGELPETIKMVYGALKAIVVKYLEVRRKVDVLRKNNVSSGDLIADIASLWMSYRYGIMPIVYSINDALDYLERQGVFRTVRQGENFEFKVETECGPVTISGRDRYWGKARVNPLDAKEGLKMNLLSTAWELVPLSFVLDWVFNVGDLLSSIIGPSGAEEIKHSYSRRVSNTARLMVDNTTFTANIEFYELAPINPMAHVGLTVDPNMTWKRTLDALALSWFMFKKDIRSNNR